MSELVEAVQNGQAADFQKLVEVKLSEKVGAILREAQQYIAGKLFEESDDDSDEAPHEDDEDNKSAD